MAPFIEHRLHPRNNTRIPTDIECVSCDTDDFFPATIFNVNGDGLYIETDHPLDTGQGIVLHTVQEVPRQITDNREINENAGIVRWTRATERSGRRQYGAGVRFFYPGMADIYGAKDVFDYYCDLCSKALGRKARRMRNDLLWMCPRCNESIEHLPRDLYLVTVRFLIGNAL